MTLKDTCGFDTRYIHVNISNPPGGVADVNPDKTISFNSIAVPEGTLLKPYISTTFCYDKCGETPNSCFYDCLDDLKRFDPSVTPAKNNGTLPVICWTKTIFLPTVKSK